MLSDSAEKIVSRIQPVAHAGSASATMEAACTHLIRQDRKWIDRVSLPASQAARTAHAHCKGGSFGTRMPSHTEVDESWVGGKGNKIDAIISDGWQGLTTGLPGARNFCAVCTAIASCEKDA